MSMSPGLGDGAASAGTDLNRTSPKSPCTLGRRSSSRPSTVENGINGLPKHSSSASKLRRRARPSPERVLRIRGRHGYKKLANFLDSHALVDDILYSLHIELGEQWLDEFADDMWSIQLNRLHKSTSLKELYIYIKGDFMFTQNTYTTCSVAAATFLKDDFVMEYVNYLFHDWMRGEKLRGEDLEEIKRHLDRLVHNIPKTIVNALLGLARDATDNQPGHSLEVVEIYGPMETELKNLLINGLIKEELESDGEEEQVLKVGELADLSVISRQAPRQSSAGKLIEYWSSCQQAYDRPMTFPTDQKYRVPLGYRVATRRR